MNLKIGKNVVRGQHSKIISSKSNRKSAYFRIKDSLNFPELCEAADYIDKNLNEKFKDPIFGRPLPKDLEELGKTEYIPATKNFSKEINWVLISARKYHPKLSLFLEYKQKFENYFLLFDYDKAEMYLNKVEKEICFS